MQNVDRNLLPSSELDAISKVAGSNSMGFWRWMVAMQDDNQKLPDILRQSDLVGGVNFPALPSGKVGLLFLSSGTYEAVIIGGIDKWRRLYDGTTFDPATAAP